MRDLKEYYENFDINQLKGDVGEVLIAKEFRQLGLTVIRNVYVPIDDFFTEIDMVVVDKFGNVFVIEVKNFSGYIDCKDTNIYDTDYWLHITNMCRFVYFQNPYKQNKFHCFALKQYLGSLIDYNINIINLVIFTDKSELSYKLKNKILVEKDIHNWYNENVDIVAIKDMSKIINKIRNISDMSEERKSQHIKEIEERRNLCKKR